MTEQPFLVSAYLISAVTLVALTGWTLLRASHIRRRLAQLEAEQSESVAP